jgi:hypothetical protein
MFIALILLYSYPNHNFSIFYRISAKKLFRQRSQKCEPGEREREKNQSDGEIMILVVRNISNRVYNEIPTVFYPFNLLRITIDNFNLSISSHQRAIHYMVFSCNNLYCIPTDGF